MLLCYVVYVVVVYVMYVLHFTDGNEGCFVCCNDKLQCLMILPVVTNGNSELSTSGREKSKET